MRDNVFPDPEDLNPNCRPQAGDTNFVFPERVLQDYRNNPHVLQKLEQIIRGAKPGKKN